MTNLVIGQVVSGTWWKNGFATNGQILSGQRFENGIVIGFTKVGGPIIELIRGDVAFKVYRTEVDDVSDNNDS